MKRVECGAVEAASSGIANVVQRANFHTHTTRCGHAVGTPTAYVEEALAQQVTMLGFSDHAPFPDERYRDSRMAFAELPDYCAEIRDLRRRYAGKIVLPLGLEADFFPSVGRAFYEDCYLARYQVDYLIAGIHYPDPYCPEQDIWRGKVRLDVAGIAAHVRSATAAIESGLFLYLAHPDVFTRCCPVWSPDLKAASWDLLQAAKACDVPLEINAYGFRKPALSAEFGNRQPYPWRPFWELVATCGNRVVIGCDAHRPEDVWGNGDQMIHWTADLGLTPCNEALAAQLASRMAKQ